MAPGTPDRTEERPPRAVRLRTGRTDFVVGGLDEAEQAEIARNWSRCSPEPLDGAHAAEPDLDRRTRPDQPWDDFHETLVYRATSRTIESGRGRDLMFHAACLADPATGSAVLLAAASGTGKTTATRRLGPHYAYLTDETAMVDVEDLSVTPYPKPLSLLQDGRRPKRQVSPDELGLGPDVPAVLRRVAVLDRERDAAEEDVAARAERMDLAEALVLLVPQTSSLAHLERGLVTLCRTLDRLGGVQRLVYAEAEDLRPVVDALLAAEPAPVDPEWEALDDAELAASAGIAAGPAADDVSGTARVHRAAADCGIELADGRLVLLMGQQLIILDGLGPALWLLLDTPRTAPELLAELTDLGPVPDGAPERLGEAVAALVQQGVVWQEDPRADAASAEDHRR